MPRCRGHAGCSPTMVPCHLMPLRPADCSLQFSCSDGAVISACGLPQPGLGPRGTFLSLKAPPAAHEESPLAPEALSVLVLCSREPQVPGRVGGTWRMPVRLGPPTPLWSPSHRRHLQRGPVVPDGTWTMLRPRGLSAPWPGWTWLFRWGLAGRLHLGVMLSLPLGTNAQGWPRGACSHLRGSRAVSSLPGGPG